jgi:hypothetical protein
MKRRRVHLSALASALWSTLVPVAPGSDRESLLGVRDWLLVAQREGGQGYAHSFSLRGGWLPAYPETTGYIIPTMLRIGSFLGDKASTESALIAGRWLLSVQLPNGAFPDMQGRPQVFDTGQIIEGLLALFRMDGDNRWLESASRAAAFLVSSQDADGPWTRHSYNQIPHVYYTRVAASLLEYTQASGCDLSAGAGRRMYDWALSCRLDNGYFRHMAFAPGELPFLHTIVYVLEGLIDGYGLSGRGDLKTAVAQGIERLAQVHRRDGILRSQYDENWQSPEREYCVTGLAQWAGLLYNWEILTGDSNYRELADSTLNFLKQRQVRFGPAAVRGALSGSLPIWGSYFRFAFNNWTAKFMADALMASQGMASLRKAPEEGQ